VYGGVAIAGEVVGIAVVSAIVVATAGRGYCQSLLLDELNIMTRWLVVFLVFAVGVFEARVRPRAAIVTWFLAITMAAFFLAVPSASLDHALSTMRLLIAGCLWITALGVIGFWYKRNRG
jgi:hypothetical protein